MSRLNRLSTPPQGLIGLISVWFSPVGLSSALDVHITAPWILVIRAGLSFTVPPWPKLPNITPTLMVHSLVSSPLSH